MDVAFDSRKEVATTTILLDKSVRQFTLYGTHHRLFQTTLQDLQNQLERLFAQVQPLSLEIKRTQLVWKGEEVFKLEKRENNYVQEMYVDGLRRLEILPNVSAGELTSFISVLGRDVHNYEVREDDTVTLLWKKGFQNIRYQTIDIYAGDRFFYMQDEAPEEELSQEDREERDYWETFMYRLIHGERATNIGREGSSASPSAGQGFSEEIQQAIPLSMFQTSEEEKEALREKSIAAVQRNYLPEVQVVFSEVLEHQVDTPDFERLVAAYMKIVGNLLEREEVAAASDWIGKYRAVQAHAGRASIDAHEIMEEGLVKFARPELFRLLGEKIAEGTQAKPEEWIRLLTYFGKGAVASICEMLSQFPQETLHSTIVTFLTRHAPDETKTYLANLKRSEWMLVRDMVRVLAEVLDERRIEEALKPVAIHPQAEVRREVVRAMKNVPAETGRNFLRRGLGDSEASVRELALQLVARSGDAYFAKILATRIGQEAILEVLDTEKRLTCIALARCGGNSTYEFLAEVAGSKGSGSAIEDLRAAALYGMAELSEPRATQLIKDYAGKRLLNPTIRDAAKRLKARKSRPAEKEDPDE